MLQSTLQLHDCPDALAFVQASLRVQSHPHHHHHHHEKEDKKNSHDDAQQLQQHHDQNQQRSDHREEEDEVAGLVRAHYDKPVDGDVFLGSMDCTFGPVGLRVEFDSFPTMARVEFFPQSTFDETSHMWCRPLSPCSGSYNVSGTWTNFNGMVLQLRPSVWSGRLENSCGWPAFGLKGLVEAAGDSLKLSGTPEGSSRLSASLAHQDAQPPQVWGLPRMCRAKHRALQRRGTGGSCNAFTLTACNRGMEPKEGEKVVYFIRHGEQRNQPEDGNLTMLGETQARNLRENPLLARALSGDPGQRAQVIFVSPMARTMHTAVLGFGELGISTIVDVNLVELASEPTRAEGEALLRNINATGLMKQYASIWKSTDQGDALAWGPQEGSSSSKQQTVPTTLEERTARFVERLQHRPEQRIIVIGHNNYFKTAGIYVKGFGTMAARVLGRNGEWREATSPACWPSVHGS